MATAVAEPAANTTLPGAVKSKLFAVPLLAFRLTVSGCERSPVRVSVKARTPPSVAGPGGEAMVTVGSAPASLSMMMPVVVPKPL